MQWNQQHIGWGLGCIWLFVWSGLCGWGMAIARERDGASAALAQGASTKASPGFLVLKITPIDALVKIDGRRVSTAQGKATRGLTLSVGKHQLQVDAPGHVTLKRELQIFADDASLLRLTLAPTPVEVSITSTPSGALLSLNRRILGKTPYIGQVTPRWYQARASLAGYVMGRRDILVTPTSGQRFHLRLGGALRVRDGHAMRWVPGRYFARGSRPEDVISAQRSCQKLRKSACSPLWFTAEQPQRQIWVDSFWIDQHEVTNQQYRRCVQAGGCAALRFLERGDTLPVVAATWQEARTYCLWRKARLPREAEWELTAKGPRALIYPWGHRWKAQVANHGTFDVARQSSVADATDRFQFAAPVGSFPEGRSPYRVEDLAGNVAEWVGDCYFTSYFRKAPERNPFHNPKDCDSRVVRGGSWIQPAWELRSTARQPLPPSTRSLTVGFRCVRPVPTTSSPKEQRDE